MHRRPCAGARIGGFGIGEEPREHSLALAIEQPLDAGHFDEVDPDAGNHEPSRVRYSLSRTTCLPLRATTT